MAPGLTFLQRLSESLGKAHQRPALLQAIKFLRQRHDGFFNLRFRVAMRREEAQSRGLFRNSRIEDGLHVDTALKQSFGQTHRTKRASGNRQNDREPGAQARIHAGRFRTLQEKSTSRVQGVYPFGLFAQALQCCLALHRRESF